VLKALPLQKRRRERRGSVRAEPERTGSRHAHSRHVRPCPLLMNTTAQPLGAAHTAHSIGLPVRQQRRCSELIEKGYMMRPVAHARKTPVPILQDTCRACRAPRQPAKLAARWAARLELAPFISMRACVLPVRVRQGGAGFSSRRSGSQTCASPCVGAGR